MDNMQVNQRRKQTVNLFLILCTASLAFLAGYSLNRVLTNRPNTTRLEYASSLFKRDVRPETEYKRNFEFCDQLWSDLDQEYIKYHDDALHAVSKENIDEIHKNLTEIPHLAGSARNNEIGDFIAEKWQEYGMKIYKKTYEVLLSEPKSPAVLQLFHSNGSIDYEPKMVEEAFFKEENSTDSVFPFNAYTKSGDIKAQYVYVNEGSHKDYKEITDRNITIKGKIFIAQYGKLARSAKVLLAEKYGAVGLLLYPPKEDVLEPNQSPYPDSWGLPPKAIPRGTLSSVKGDPLTPEWPAKPGMFRIPENGAKLPDIVVQPISYEIAYKLLSEMDGIEVPMGWKLHAGNNTRINTTRMIRLKVDVPRVTKNITNIIGVMKGDTEPDRIVVIGNHRDAWVYGGGDPSSGTACIMEVARVLGELSKGSRDWKPRRTIIFASWDAEEYGLVGSIEWLQEYTTVMQAKTVAYINVDIGVSGTYSFRARGTPSLADSLYNVTKDIDDPDMNEPSNTENFKKVYDRWKSRIPDSFQNGLPVVTPPKSGSDFQGFYTMFGIPILDVRYEYNKTLGFSNYPTYHTIYDNYQYYKKFIDPDTRYHKTVTQVLLRQLLTLADDVILPFNLTRYAEVIVQDLDAMAEVHGKQFKKYNVSFDRLLEVGNELMNATLDFHKQLSNIKKGSIYNVRRMNDKLMWFERAFIVPEGIQGEYGLRHVIYSPSPKNMYSRNSFPGLASLLYDIEVDGKPHPEHLNIQFSILMNCLENAIRIISSDSL